MTTLLKLDLSTGETEAMPVNTKHVMYARFIEGSVARVDEFGEHPELPSYMVATFVNGEQIQFVADEATREAFTFN
ncbi:hypothetical protein [Klebsiella variicola]|uniref:hypothetical protein n=1 Tax=Klebsiella variicola TaxID=244366 RepID=UPI0034DE62A4